MRIITSGRGFGLLPVPVFRDVFLMQTAAKFRRYSMRKNSSGIKGKKSDAKKQRENSKQKPPQKIGGKLEKNITAGNSSGGG